MTASPDLAARPMNLEPVGDDGDAAKLCAPIAHEDKQERRETKQ